jgi:hypothetical protein
MQEHYCLANSIGEDKANVVFNNATQKVIKDAFKHAHYIFVASYYTGEFTSLLHAGVEVIDFLIWHANVFFLHAGVEAVDEAHTSPWDLSDQGAAPSREDRLVG